jgi:structure-specific endonuclease subunit SLX1
MYLVYILKSDNKTYIGMTNDFFRRWRQHNGDLKGGAKYTTRNGKDWYPICIIDGFETMKEACQCEWSLKHNKKFRGHMKRVEYVSIMIHKKQWTSKSPLIKDQKLTIYVDDDYTTFFNNYPTKQLYWK